MTAIDTDRRAVLVRDLDGGGQKWEGFDQLMIATSAGAARLSWLATFALST